jgi:uncharacterized protein YdaU (DUF1376 family)
VGEIKWYKRDPDAALVGMADLDLMQRGAYNTVLDLIYSRGNLLADDDKHLAAVMRCDVRRWRTLKSALLAAGKIYVAAGLIRNKRADREITSARLRMAHRPGRRPDLRPISGRSQA